MKSQFFAVSALFLIISCGGSDGGGGSASGPQREEIALEEDQGLYLATLRPLNTHLSGFLPTGQMEIKVGGSAFQVKSVLEDDAPVVHMLNMHTSSECPSMGHDSNGDGLVDVNEMSVATGPVILPFDSDLSFQEKGEFPRGSFTYVRSISVGALMQDLMAPDSNPNDHIVKLSAAESFGLEGKVVMVHGVNGGTTIPTTVTSLGNMTPQASIPVACGILRKIK